MTTGQNLRASKRAAIVLLAAAIATATRLSAHRLDECLQAARIAVERDRVQLEINLTPGAAVADGVIREVDADGNGVLSHDEQQAYAGRVLSALTLRVDDSPPLHLQLAAASFPDAAALRAGDGAIVIRSAADLSALPVGSHRVFFRNQHAASNSVYLANALVPESSRVSVTGQRRDGDQRELTIDVVIGQGSGHWMWLALVGGLVAGWLMWRSAARVRKSLRWAAAPMI
jgi:hypothetical protein